MSEDAPTHTGRLSELVLEINEGSGEPDDSASIRAERGSPTPSCVTLDATQSSPYPVFKTSDSDPAISTEINTVTVPTVSVTGATSDFTPNQEFLKVLLSLGFDEFISVLALKRTQNQGVEQAVDWIVEHSNPSDFEEEDSSSDESESEPEGEVEVESKLESEMGVASSAVSGTGAAGIQDSIMKAAMAVQKSARTHKMVLVANMGLKMGTGKLAAQVGHATLAVYRMADSSENGKVGLDSWFRRGQVKIVLKGKDTEELMDLFKSAKDAGLFAYLVQDAGYTQIPPGSRTVLAVFGEKDKVDSITGHLRLL